MHVNNSHAPDDDPSLIAIDGEIATSDEFAAATVVLVRELGQFGKPGDCFPGT
jgi:hypothetical protein